MANRVSIHGEFRFEDGGCHFISTDGDAVDFGPFLGDSKMGPLVYQLLGLAVSKMADSLGAQPDPKITSLQELAAGDLNQTRAYLDKMLADSLSTGAGEVASDG